MIACDAVALSGGMELIVRIGSEVDNLDDIKGFGVCSHNSPAEPSA